MLTTYLSLISLFISCFILMMGNGLVNVLLPVKMELENLNTNTIGLVLSLFYVGMLLGAIYSKYLISRAGHVRVFAGCVALAAVSILISSFDSDPLLWGAMRVVIGFCNACAFTAMESWLSDSSNKATRGKILALYNAVALSGLFVGQFLLNLASPNDSTLFVVAGVLLCLAIIPITLGKSSGPKVEEVVPMSIFSLIAKSPLAVVCCVTGGMIYAALFNMLPMFAKHYQIVDFQLTLYMATAIFGAFALQFPVGYLSDKYDRRSVIFFLLLLSAGAGIIATLVAPLQYEWPLFVATSLTTGIIACLYPLSISEAFDKLRQNEMVAAMGSMILAFSLGGVIGPYSAALVMGFFGNAALFYFLAIVQVMLAGFVLYRMQARDALPIDKQESFVMQSSTGAAMVDLDPRTEYVPVQAAFSHDAQIAINIAQTDQSAAVNMARAIAINQPERAVEMARALASVKGIDVLSLYEVMREALPYRIMEIATAMVATAPNLAYELIQKLAITHPEQVVSVAAEIGHSFPELRVAMAKVAVESAPQSAVQVAEYYAQVIVDEREALRPADEEADTSEQDLVDIAAQLWESAPDHALDVAVTMAEAVPEAAVSLAGDLAENIMSEDAESEAEASPEYVVRSDSQNAEDVEAALELVQRFTDAVPDSAMDVAVAVVEAIPEAAAMIASEVASNIVDEEPEQVMSTAAQAQQDILDHDAAVDLVQRLTEVSPSNALDVAVAVVEAVPESAALIASEVASNIVDEEPEQAKSESAQAQQDILDHDAAVDLVQRLIEVSPDNALDVAVAVVEAVPESAALIASEVASNIIDEEFDQAMSESAQAQQDILNHDAAVDLVQRLIEVSPDNALDVAVAVVEALPESAAMIASEVASKIIDEEPDQAKSESAQAQQAILDHDAAVDLVLRLTEASPDNALEVAIAVVEEVPESAAMVASEVATSIMEGQLDTESSNAGLKVADRSELADIHQSAMQTDAAIDLVQKLTQAAPDNALDVALAVVEAVPDSAGIIAGEVINNLTQDTSVDAQINKLERAHQRAINTETAIDLVQRFSEAAPDNVIDVAAAAVDVVPESASLFVDSISEGDESKEGEWMSRLDEAPRDLNEVEESQNDVKDS